MKIPAKDTQKNGATESSWPSVRKIDNNEFEQSFAVAQLAVKLCELQKRELQNKWEAEDRKYSHDAQTAVTESEKKRVNEERDKQMERRIPTLDPEGFLARAWQLIEKAGEHVFRDQTDAEYLVTRGGSREAAENAVERILSASRVPFQKLCNKQEIYTAIELHDAETGKTIEVEWKVYRSEAGFDKLFWAYWRVTSTLRLRMIISPDAPGNAPDNWEEYGKQKLASWKRHCVPPNEFLALARFRKEHDQRAANLKSKAATEA